MSEKALAGIRNLMSPNRTMPSGWFSLEDIGFLRGWCMDRANPDTKLQIELRIDGQPVATVLADRPHAKLIENQEGDGHYAFAFLIPPKYRDDNPHTVSAVVVTPGYDGFALKIKVSEFRIAQNQPYPRVVLERLTAEGFEGELFDHKSARKDSLDIWRDGVRVPGTQTRWFQTPGGRSRFSVAVPGRRPSDLLSASLVVAYPGVQELQQKKSDLAPLLQLRTARLPSGEIQISFGSAIVIPDGATLAIAVRDGEAGKPITDTVRIHDNRALFRLDSLQGGDPLLTVSMPDGAALSGDIALHGAGRMLENGALRHWDTDGAPEQWSVPGDVSWERSFYNFPAAMAAGLPGKVLVLGFTPSSGSQVLLRQGAKRSPGRMDKMDVGFMLRASQAVELEFRLVNEAGQTVATACIQAGQRWKHGTVALQRNGTAALPLTFEMVASGAGGKDPVYVELAGLHCGASDEGFDDAASVRARAAGENLVVNSDLQSWPHGLVFDDIKGRFEAAQGWSLFNRNASVPALASIALMPAGKNGPRHGINLSASDVPEHCRVEIALENAQFWGLWHLEIAAKCLPQDQKKLGVPSRWTQIDKILVRCRKQGRDTIVARVARRVLVTGAWETLRFDFVFNDDGDLGEFEQVESAAADYVLVLEFRQPFSICLHSASLHRAADAVEGGDPTPLRLEDANIRAQVETIKGLEFWNTPGVVAPVLETGGIACPPAERPALQWNWKSHRLGSVEVGICVHNAIDETMACLQSLAGASTVPHTVRVINDGSDEIARRRILQFIADKPWMTLEDNDGNRGYTYSANRVVGRSTADWVILLNSDTIVSPGWIEGLLDVTAGDPRVAMVGPVSNAATYQSVPELYDGAGKWAINDLPPGWTAADVAASVNQNSLREFPEVPLLNGFCTLINRAIFTDVGGLDEEAFPMGYGEENDLCTRVRKAGYKLCVADHVYVYHSKSASFGTERRKELAKAGDKALKELHADVDFGVLTKRFMETPALVLLRQRMRQVYSDAPVRAGEAS